MYCWMRSRISCRGIEAPPTRQSNRGHGELPLAPSEARLEREQELPLVARPVEGMNGAQLQYREAERVDPQAGTRTLDPRTVAERRRWPAIVAAPRDARVEEADEIHRQVAVVDPSLEEADERRADLDVRHQQAAA